MAARRQPAVAGMFYDADPMRLRRSIEMSFADSVPVPPGAAPPKIVIVPHAGYVYSGPVAASAFARVAARRGVIERVVLLGPSHRVYLRGMAVSAADAFTTPLGDVPVDAEMRDAITGLAGVVVDDGPHRHEHSLEVELPFLQTVLGDFTLLPLSVGDAASDEVAAVLDVVWGGDETLIVVSTDLSHYHRYDDARAIDERTAAAIVAGDGAAIADEAACGARPLRGALDVARRRGLRVEQVDLRSSGDTAGDHSRVVGYGAFVIS